MYEDRKVILDCYQYKKDVGNGKPAWDLVMIEVDVEINGHYVI